VLDFHRGVHKGKRRLVVTGQLAIKKLEGNKEKNMKAQVRCQRSDELPVVG